MKAKEEYQKLENQICFSLYAASRLVTKCYKPLLKDFEITYPQYLVLLVLWEQEAVSLNFIAEKLLLQSNTLTPLVKRMEELELLTRTKSHMDERSIIISLAEKGRAIKDAAIDLPFELVSGFNFSMEEITMLKTLLDKLVNNLNDDQ
ncbi:organic hydroperoxide resistance transcriptional regulator [Neptunitalea chrysea]|uniref:Organic hydroperoxide resistance transcriptional regulator n=1 Tax=Neptunitalea chrysea TaxID=1647581 RepID=A0A9W6B5B9_9FLAO|nr:MarR family transcriptional regulator [Neptunitalea chrysea]GLB51612.1 organic hydroperoxide resistance transcriptional regulator [Neptunitalea chrysea]